MSIPREFIDILLAKIDIIDLINTHIPLKKKSGSNYFARCPFHNEKSASFSVSQPKQFYYCFGCGAHGNAIDFMMNHDHLSFPEAIEVLARQIGMEVPQTLHAPSKKDDSLPALYELVTHVADYYYEQMRQSSRAINYLKNRGISGVIAQQFLLGYAQTGWNHLLDHAGKTDADKRKLLDTGLIIKKDEGGYYDRFRDRIIFPIHDYRGRIIGFGGRILDQGEPKYLNSPETPLFQKGHELYGLYQALKVNRKLDKAIIVEGYMDVIALFQHGITYAVATLGTATTPHHLQRLFRYTSEIIFCFDGDQAGRTAAWRALQVLFPMMHDQLQVRFLFLPDGEDPDSLIRKEGQIKFEERLSKAPSLSHFFFDTLSKQSDLNTLEGRAQFATQALSHIKQLPPELFQGMMLEELSKRTRILVSELKQQIKPGSETGIRALSLSPSTKTPAKTKFPANIRLALALLVQHPNVVQHFDEPLPTTDLPGHALLSQLIDIIKQNKELTTGSLLEYWRGQENEPIIAALARYEHHVPEKGVGKEFLGLMKQLASLNVSEEINRLLAKASQTGLSDSEKQTLTQLIAKKKEKESF